MRFDAPHTFKITVVFCVVHVEPLLMVNVTNGYIPFMTVGSCYIKLKQNECQKGKCL